MRARLFIRLVVAAAIAAMTGCSYWQSTAEEGTPLIIAQGSSPAGNTFEFLESSWWDSPELWVLVGHTDGLEEISAVFLDIDNIEITDLIIRPSIGSPCISVDFSAAAIPTNAILALPYRLESIHDKRMNHEQGGIYTISPFHRPQIKEESPVLDDLIHGCGEGGNFWDWFSLNPPAVPTAVDVFLTRMVVHFEGISVTVYDAAGNIESTTFPDMQLVFSSDAEEAVAP